MDKIESNLITHIDNNLLKYREIYYNFRDYIKKLFYNEKEDIYNIKHIINIFYNFISNIPEIHLLFNNILSKELVLDNLLEELKTYIDDVFTIRNFINFSYKLYNIKKVFDYEEHVFLFADEFIKNIPYHNDDLYKNKEFNNFVNNWIINMKKILPINFQVKELEYMFDKKDFANLIYHLNYDEYRKGIITLSELITFIIYFILDINIINKNNLDSDSIKNLCLWSK
jgi:hypothetical protein